MMKGNTSMSMLDMLQAFYRPVTKEEITQRLNPLDIAPSPSFTKAGPQNTEIHVNGKVIDLSQNHIVLKLDNNELLKAPTNGPLPLSIGDEAEFVVKLNDKEIVTLKIVHPEDEALQNAGKVIEKALQNAKLPISERAANVVAALYTENLALSEKNIKKYIAMSAKYPQLSEKEVVALDKNGLMPFIPLYLKAEEEEAHGEIYVSAKPANDDTKTLSAYLKLTTKTLGQVDALLLLNNKSLTARFSVETETAKEVLREELQAFEERLNKKGFSTLSDVGLSLTFSDETLKAAQKGNSTRFSFDMRA